MKTLLCRAYGPPSSLTLEDVPSPEPGPRQVRIRVEAAGVNFPDLLMIQGKYQFQPPFPFAPGNEVAGVVEAVGEGTSIAQVGDRVLATVPWGGYAEEVVAEELSLIPLPPDMGWDVAAAFVVTYATSQHALVDRAELKAGETLLVLGAAGGVGLAAVQIGKAMGAKVIAAASSDDKLAVCKAHGADEVINYTREDLKKRAKTLTDGQGVDVVYDPVGGALSEAALRAVAWNGRFLVVGFASGEVPSIPLNLPLLKGCAILGVYWGSFAARDPARHKRHLGDLMTWIRDGKIAPHVSKVYDLEDGARALQDIADRKVVGKVVISPRR